MADLVGRPARGSPCGPWERRFRLRSLREAFWLDRSSVFGMTPWVRRLQHSLRRCLSRSNLEAFPRSRMRPCGEIAKQIAPERSGTHTLSQWALAAWLFDASFHAAFVRLWQDVGMNTH